MFPKGVCTGFHISAAPSHICCFFITNYRICRASCSYSVPVRNLRASLCVPCGCQIRAFWRCAICIKTMSEILHISTVHKIAFCALWRVNFNTKFTNSHFLSLSGSLITSEEETCGWRRDPLPQIRLTTKYRAHIIVNEALTCQRRKTSNTRSVR